MSITEAIYHWWQVRKAKLYISRIYKAFGADKDVVESSECRCKGPKKGRS